MREAQIKSALIDRLFQDGFIDEETVVISELPVASWSRRADLVLANGKISGFEIKSKFDSTTRLAAQLEAYATSFEGVSVLIDEKHLHAVESLASKDIGIFLITDSGGAPAISMVRKPHFRALSVEAALRLMLATDLQRLLRREGGSVKEMGRQRLEDEVRQLPVSVVRDAAASALKSRYQRFHQEFISARKAVGSTVDVISKLGRPRWSDHARAGKSHERPDLPVIERGDHEQLRRLVVTPRRVIS